MVVGVGVLQLTRMEIGLAGGAGVGGREGGAGVLGVQGGCRQWQEGRLGQGALRWGRPPCLAKESDSLGVSVYGRLV